LIISLYILKTGTFFIFITAIYINHSIVSEPFLRMGNEVGYDIRTWRNLQEGLDEEKLDSEALFLLEFTKTMLKKYRMA